MNGFLLDLSDAETPSRLEDFTAPGRPEEDHRRIEVAGRVRCVTWGGARGDVHVSFRDDKSALILSGCVSWTKLLDAFETQEQAAELLRKRLDADHSWEGLAEVARGLIGEFGLVYVDWDEQTACFITDRIASRPIWLHAEASHRAVSTHPAAIARSAGALECDLGALASLLLYARPIDLKHSLCRGVEALPAAATAILSGAGGLDVRRWRRPRYEPETRCPYKRWLKRAHDAFLKAAERTLSGSKNPVVFLSGGVDSRLVASTLRAAGGQPYLVTLSDSENLEVRVARKVASALGGEHEVILRDPHWHLSNLTEAAFETSGSFVWIHGHFARAYEAVLSRRGVDAALTGDNIDAFSNLNCVVEKGRTEAWTPEEFADGLDDLFLSGYGPADRRTTLGLLTPEARAEAESELRANIMRRYEEIRDVSPEPRTVADFFISLESPMCNATFFSQLDVRAIGAERSLMSDPGVQELLETMPAAIRDNACFGARLVKTLWPPAARVVNANTLLPLATPYAAQEFARRVRPILGKFRRMLFEDSHKSTESWPHLPMLFSQDAKWRSCIEGVLLNNELFPHDVFDRKAIEQAWESFLGGEMGRHADIEKLLQLGILNAQCAGSDEVGRAL
jgi:hypothetical protein